MSDKRLLKTIGTRYDLEAGRHRDPWRTLRGRLSVVFAVGSLAAGLPWLLGDHRAFQSRCVSEPHRVFEQNCQSCHDRSAVPLLRMVTFDNSLHSTSDKKCQVCHKETNDDHLSRPIAGDLSRSDHPDAVGSDDPGAAEGIERGRSEALQHQFRGQFAGLGCAGCHQEHRGHANLAEVADAHCAKCHAEAHRSVSPRRFELDFAEFGRESAAGHHPEFAVWRRPDATQTFPTKDVEHVSNVLESVENGHVENVPHVRFGPSSETSTQFVAAVAPAGSGLVKWEQDRPVDQSAIKFSHHRHLDPQLPIQGGKTTSLNCVDCHQPEPGGAYFRPLTFAQDCQRCHSLGFPSTGGLPHSKPEIIRGILLDRLAKNAGKTSPLPAATDQLGGPTKAPIAASKSDQEIPPGLAALAGELEKLERQLFAAPSPAMVQATNARPQVAGLLEAACMKCHFTKRTGGTSGTGATDGADGTGGTNGTGGAWSVIPPRLPSQWMGHARFRHDRHSSVDCQVCHTRNGDRFEKVVREQFYPVVPDELKDSPSIHASVSARDVLMPRIEVCRQCHGHGSASGGHRAAGDNCVDCHSYHHSPLATKVPLGIIDLLQSGRPGSRDAKPAATRAEASR